jgi:hypothetical protein
MKPENTDWLKKNGKMLEHSGDNIVEKLDRKSAKEILNDEIKIVLP